jgi:protein-tyrosine phosphatase
MSRLYSFYLFIIIQFQRGADHVYRWTTGLPMVRRSMITPQVYLGGQYGIRRISTLHKLGITGIVNMRMHSIHTKGSLEGCTILNLPTPDRHPPTIENLMKGARFIQKQIDAGGKVYIHCRWGEGRGASMAIAYLISSGMTYDDAYMLVKKVRTFISPTKLQIERLREFEKEYNRGNYPA